MTRNLVVFALVLACPVVAPGADRSQSDSREVTLYVTVTDKKDNLVTGLHNDLFEIYEDGELQTPRSITQDEPLSLGILLDHSWSMMRKLEVRNRAGHLLKGNHGSVDAMPQFRDVVSRLTGRLPHEANEFFLIAIGDRPSLAHDFTNDPQDILELVDSQSADGKTALLDAVKLGLTKMNEASNARRVLILLSDGGENVSVLKKLELEEAIRANSVAIYAIGVFGGRPLRTPVRSQAAPLLNRFTRQTGGMFFSIATMGGLMSSADRIAYELRHQSSIRYLPRPNNRREWRNVEVRIRWREHQHELRKAGLKPPLSARVRTGYHYEPTPETTP